MSDWKDIKSAPMDGTEILVFTKHDGVTSSKYKHGCWQKLTTVYGGKDGNEPTHWMPLPEPPQ